MFVGTISGGAGAALTNGNFWQGAVTGLIVSGLNHAMHNDTNKHLRKAGYKANKDISNIPEAERKAYILKMRNTVEPLDILYDASGASLDYESYSPNSEAEYMSSDKTVWVHSRSFTTNKGLFLNLIHEGSHAWDHSQGLYTAWGGGGIGSNREAATEVRAYNMERWFGGPIRNQNLYNTYLNRANSAFSNYQVRSYPVFFNNISK